MSVGEFCNREVVIADMATSIVDAAQLMREHHVGCLVVVDALTATERRPVGVITDRDLVVEVMAKKLSPDTLTLGDLIVGEVLTSVTSAGIYETLHYMREHGVRRMPVVNSDGVLAGLFCLDDYLELLAEEMTELTRLINTERRREAKLRP